MSEAEFISAHPEGLYGTRSLPMAVTLYNRTTHPTSNEAVDIKAAQFAVKQVDVLPEGAEKTAYRDSDWEEDFRNNAGADGQYLQIGPNFDDYLDSQHGQSKFERPVMIRSRDVYIKGSGAEKYFSEPQKNQSIKLQDILRQIKEKIAPGAENILESHVLYGDTTDVPSAIAQAKADVKNEILGEGVAEHLDQLKKIETWLGTPDDQTSLATFLDNITEARTAMFKDLVGPDGENAGVLGSMFLHDEGNNDISYVQPGVAEEQYTVVANAANDDLSKILLGLDSRGTKVNRELLTLVTDYEAFVQTYESDKASSDLQLANIEAPITDMVGGNPTYDADTGAYVDFSFNEFEDSLYIDTTDSLASAASKLDAKLQEVETTLTQLSAFVDALAVS